MSTFVKVAKSHDLAEGGMVAMLVGDTEILLAQVQGQYYAMSNVCSHADAWLHRRRPTPCDMGSAIGQEGTGRRPASGCCGSGSSSGVTGTSRTRLRKAAACWAGGLPLPSMQRLFSG